MKNLRPSLFLLVNYLILFSACSKPESGISNVDSLRLNVFEQDTPNTFFMSALRVTNQFITEIEGIPIGVELGLNGVCPQITTNCSLSEKSLIYNTCTNGIFSGSVTHSYSSSSFCNGTFFSSFGWIHRKVNQLLFKKNSGVSVQFTSDLTNSAEGAVATSNGDGTYTMSVFGIGVLSSDKNGKQLYNHQVKTTQALLIRGDKNSNTLEIYGGQFNVYNVTAAYSADIKAESLIWKDKNCCLPSQGTMTAYYSGNTSTDSVIMKFSGNGVCGLVDLITKEKGGSSSSVSAVLGACF